MGKNLLFRVALVLRLRGLKPHKLRRAAPGGQECKVFSPLKVMSPENEIGFARHLNSECIPEFSEKTPTKKKTPRVGVVLVFCATNTPMGVFLTNKKSISEC